MNKTVKKVLDILACVTVLLVLVFVSYYADRLRTVKLQQRISDLEVQLAHATIPMKTDTIRDSIPVVTQLIVEIDKTDYKQQAADRQLIKDLNLTVSQIQSENQQLRETLGKVQLHPVKNDSDILFSYHDHWADFELNMQSKQLDYAVRDSLATYVSREYRHRILWGLIKWGTKGYNVHIVNFNPNSRVAYNKTLLIE